MIHGTTSKPTTVDILSSPKSGWLGFDAQADLFPLNTLMEMPGSIGTVDVWGKVVASDTHVYFVKNDKANLSIRAAEWISTHLAEMVSIPCPTAKIVQMQDGQLFFGSREIAGIAGKVETAEILTSITAGPGSRRIPGLQSFLSMLYALDMFLDNVDRHDQNYMSVDDNGMRRFYAIDFGYSLSFENFLVGFRRQCNTIATGRLIRQRHGFDQAAASAMIDRILALASESVLGIVKQMPEDWLSIDKRRQLIEWWSSARRPERLEELRKGLADGTLL